MQISIKYTDVKLEPGNKLRVRLPDNSFIEIEVTEEVEVNYVDYYPNAGPAQCFIAGPKKLYIDKHSQR